MDNKLVKIKMESSGALSDAYNTEDVLAVNSAVLMVRARTFVDTGGGVVGNRIGAAVSLYLVVFYFIWINPADPSLFCYFYSSAHSS